MHLTILSATNRPGSNTRKLAGYLEKVVQENILSTDQVDILDLQELPTDLFLPKSYGEKPKTFDLFRDRFMKSDALLSVIPEYNGSAPGVFKYFLDLLPFPKALFHKPSAFVGLGDGRFGALRAVEHMQQVFEYRNAFVYPERVFIPFIEKALDASGKPVEPKVCELLKSEITGFVGFARKFLNT